MKKITVWSAILIITALLLSVVGCSSSSGTPSHAIPATTSAAPRTVAVGSAQGGSGKSTGSSVPSITVTSVPAYDYDEETLTEWGETQNTVSTDRMVVRTGNMEMVVNDISVAMDGITKIAADYGGYVVSSQRGKQNETNIGSISIRVLAENYDQVVMDLRTLAKSVISESTSSQDVTEEYVDLESKVKNLEASEAQLLKIMESATKTEDVITVQRELTNVRGEIEQAKGRLQYLERTSSSSLIQIQLQESVIALKFTANKTNVGTEEPVVFTPEVTGGFAPYNYLWYFGDGDTSTEINPSHVYENAGVYSAYLKVTDDKGNVSELYRESYINVTGTWKPGSVAGSAWNGFLAFGRVFVNVLIWLAVFSPVWIIIGGIIWFSLYWRRRKKKIS